MGQRNIPGVAFLQHVSHWACPALPAPLPDVRLLPCRVVVVGTRHCWRGQAFEHKAPAATLGVGRVSGLSNELCEPEIADGVAGDGEFAHRDLAHRPFVIIWKTFVIRSHEKGAADQRAPAARDRRFAGRDRRYCCQSHRLRALRNNGDLHRSSDASRYFCFSSSQNAVSPWASISARIFSRGITPQRLAQR